MSVFICATMILLIIGFMAACFGAEDQKRIEVVASIIVHEAGGEGLDGMYRVACVIQNRMIKYQSTAYEMATKPKQFSCYNMVMGYGFGEAKFISEAKRRWPAQFPAAMALAQAISKGPGLDDNTMGATHYHTRQVCPKWARCAKMRKLFESGNHIFYKEI